MSDFPPLTSVEELEAAYGEPGEASLLKVADRITPTYRRYIELSPFFVLGSVGPEGLDCSPRGELGGLLRIHDEKTLILPDWRGNNRVDTLRNIVRDPRVAALFLIPGSNTTIRLNGRAIVTLDAELLASFENKGKHPRSAVVITVDEIYTQCGRAVMRAGLWEPDNYPSRDTVPTPGEVLAEMTDGSFDGGSYDDAWAARAEKSMW